MLTTIAVSPILLTGSMLFTYGFIVAVAIFCRMNEKYYGDMDDDLRNRYQTGPSHPARIASHDELKSKFEREIK